MTTTRKLAIGLVTFGLAAALISVINCGSVSTNDLQSARNQATTASCNYYQMCNQIGMNQTFNTYQDCQNQALSFWTTQWPDPSCQGKIVQSALTMCIDAINSTLCMNGVDVLATLYVKCPEARICGAGDAGTD